MISRYLPVLLVRVLAACTLAAAAPVFATDDPELELRQRVHSHNDYEQDRPLYDALDHGLYSVEADIWSKHHDLLISHMGVFFKGSLEELYLKPLQERVDRLGSVYGDGRSFILWIDLKQNKDALEEELARELARYPMLTQFTDQEVKAGPVTVILTGKAGPKNYYADHTALRYACRDATTYSDEDPPADFRWLWYSLEWSSWMKDPAQLASLASKIHSKGRKLRIWGLPASEEIWNEMLEAKVDLVGADDLPRVIRFVRTTTHVE